LVFNKIDQVNDLNFFNNNKDVEKFIKKNNIKNIFYVNSTNEDSVKEFKNKLFQIIQNDIVNKIFKDIKIEDFGKNPTLYHEVIVDRSNRIGC